MGHCAEGTSAIGEFRERFYGCLGRRADALFELTDAIRSGRSSSLRRGRFALAQRS